MNIKCDEYALTLAGESVYQGNLQHKKLGIEILDRISMNGELRAIVTVLTCIAPVVAYLPV